MTTQKFSNGNRKVTHDSGTIEFYDSRHRILKVRCEGGVTEELVQERQVDGSFFNQILTINNGENHAVLSYPRLGGALFL